MFNFDLLDQVVQSSSVYIYSHLDIDGLTSAALFIRFLKRKGYTGDIGVHITQPYYLLKDIDISSKDDFIVILDLGVDEKILQKLKKRYLVIDHHRKSLPYAGEHVFVDVSRSVSMILGDMVGEGRFDEYLAILGGVGDKIIYDKNIGKHSVVISSAMRYNISNKWFVYHLLGLMVDGVSPYTDEMVKFYARMLKQVADVLYVDYEDFSSLFNKIKVRYYKQGYNFASVLADKMSKDYPGVPVFVITKIPYKDKILLTARISDNDNVDLGKLMHKINNKYGEVGGHRKASSVAISVEDGERMMKILEKFDSEL